MMDAITAVTAAKLVISSRSLDLGFPKLSSPQPAVSPSRAAVKPRPSLCVRRKSGA